MTYYRSCGCGQTLLGRELGQERGEVLAGKGPFKRGRRLFVMVLEAEEAILDFGQRGEVVRRQHFALDDGEIDLDLVEPARVDRRVDENEAGAQGAPPPPGAPAAGGGNAVHHPQNPPRR